MSSRPDFEVTLRVRNNHLKSRRRELGFSQVLMADAAGISKGVYSRLELMQAQPRCPDGHWTEPALALASFYDVMPEDLFPAAVQNVRTPVATREIWADELGAITNGSSQLALPPDEIYDSAERSARLSRTVDDVLGMLTERQRMVIKMTYYDEMTLEAIAQKMGLRAQRVRQILSKGLRRIRHPSRGGLLLPFFHRLEGE